MQATLRKPTKGTQNACCLLSGNHFLTPNVTLPEGEVRDGLTWQSICSLPRGLQTKLSPQFPVKSSLGSLFKHEKKKKSRYQMPSPNEGSPLPGQGEAAHPAGGHRHQGSRESRWETLCNTTTERPSARPFPNPKV